VQTLKPEASAASEACSVLVTLRNGLFRPFFVDIAGEDACSKPGEHCGTLMCEHERQ
jgi:hypothetical protein